MKLISNSLMFVGLLVGASSLPAIDPPQSKDSCPSSVCQKNGTPAVASLSLALGSQAPLVAQACSPKAEACCADGKACCADGKACSADGKPCCADAKICCPDGKSCGKTCSEDDCGSESCHNGTIVGIQALGLPPTHFRITADRPFPGMEFEPAAASVEETPITISAKEYAQLLVENARLQERATLIERISIERCAAYETIVKIQKESFAEAMKLVVKNTTLEAQLAASKEKNDTMLAMSNSLVQQAVLSARLAQYEGQGNIPASRAGWFQVHGLPATTCTEPGCQNSCDRVLTFSQEMLKAKPVPFAPSYFNANRSYDPTELNGAPQSPSTEAEVYYNFLGVVDASCETKEVPKSAKSDAVESPK